MASEKWHFRVQSAVIIDSHIHLFQNRVLSDRSEFLHKDKAFCALYSPRKSRLASRSQIIDYMDKFSISKAVVFGFPWQDPELFRENNDAVLEFASRKPERIIPFATLGLDNADAACVEVERSLKSGFRGIGELSMYENGWDKASIGTLNDCVRIASSYRVPVMLHVNEPVGHNYPGKVFVDFNELLATIGNFPDVDFILAHLGGGIFFYSLMPEIAAILKNTYVDTAATPYIYDSRIFDISVNLMWEDRVLFGSDYPLLGLERYLREFEKSSMTDAQKNKILGQNAMGLLKLTSGE